MALVVAKILHLHYEKMVKDVLSPLGRLPMLEREAVFPEMKNVLALTERWETDAHKSSGGESESA